MKTNGDDSGPSPSYHDVEVFVGGRRYKPSEAYGLELTCTKSGGWSLWADGLLVGGEYESARFEIRAAGALVCRSVSDEEVSDPERAAAVEKAVAGLWTGGVERAGAKVTLETVGTRRPPC